MLLWLIALLWILSELGSPFWCALCIILGYMLIAIILVLLGIGAAMVVHVDAAQNYPLKIWMQNENGHFMTLNVIDENTGVNYVVVCYDDIKGSGVTICPRYNADGSLYVTP